MILQNPIAELNFHSGWGCNKINFTYQVINSSDNQPNGRILFRFEPGRDEFNIYMITKQGKELLAASSSEFSKLKRGKYAIVITGKHERQNYCPEYLELEVK
ncbi:MAG: hypothetical protein N2044_11250 [Cyclobacteriaceae bacterium]|nr:hypothetical protein [Cyclobacteriaceae bacterium]